MEVPDPPWRYRTPHGGTGPPMEVLDPHGGTRPPMEVPGRLHPVLSLCFPRRATAFELSSMLRCDWSDLKCRLPSSCRDVRRLSGPRPDGDHEVNVRGKTLKVRGRDRSILFILFILIVTRRPSSSSVLQVKLTSFTHMKSDEVFFFPTCTSVECNWRKL
ncbi:hypothetical protein EYF80_064303 [Liparis tanakae]|uniref:GON domain-containing protein n=1 Tax=Liparis tanakae TaxID=230148 RepID=A0A4Z2E9M9_9TELE|nr:hypothetical protein EYF80_064303 [Liparis tanakae]